MTPKENKFKYAVKYIIKAEFGQKSEISETILSSPIQKKTKLDIANSVEVPEDCILDFQSVTTYAEYQNFLAKTITEKEIALNCSINKWAEELKQTNGFFDMNLKVKAENAKIEVDEAINELNKFMSFYQKGDYKPDDVFNTY